MDDDLDQLRILSAALEDDQDVPTPADGLLP